jgi:hypothetical protein
VFTGEVACAAAIMAVFARGGVQHPPPRWVAEVFFSGVFVQSAALVLAVTHGLVRDTLSELVRLLPRL